MKKKKFLACLMAGAMVLSLAACGDGGNQTPETATDVVETTPAETGAVDDQTTPAAEEASIDFEDGNMGFVQVYSKPANAGAAELSVVDFAGSKALQVKYAQEGSKVVPYVGIDASSLLGADVAKVASMEVSLGVSYEDGSFNAVSGKIYAWSGADLVESSDEWSVYLESANPKKAVATLAEGEEFVADAGNLFIISLETDNGVGEGKGNATLYIDNIRFLDASGNLLAADSSVAFAGPESFTGGGADYSNLAIVTNAVEFEGFATSGDGWAQDGFEMPQEVIDALVPGSVVEISYSSETGNMWLVMPDAAAGWMRVGDGNNGKSYVNNSMNVAQVTYEQIAEFCGDDVSTWGARMQCESDGAWEVYSVKVGQKAPVYTVSNAVEFEGFATSGDGWAQDGFEMPQEVIDALVPGSVVEVEFSSESGKLWLVMPDAAAGWMRVGDGNNGTAVCYDGKAYITYEQIAEFCGEDKSTWGARMQCESDTAWEVYAVRVGTAATAKMVNNLVSFEGFATSGDGWAQDGFEMPQEIIDALVPGAVVEVAFSSESGKLWLVMPDATAGWMRVGDGNNGNAACLNGVCQVTYEQIAEFCGDDVSAWGARMQCESDTAWEVYSVSVGMGAE